MTDQEKQSDVSEYECSMCGRDGGPAVGCELCGGNERFLAKREFTLSEERQGKNPNAGDRYSRTGDVSPKLVVLPGGTIPGRGGGIG